jgi:AraC family transcriptional regulator
VLGEAVIESSAGLDMKTIRARLRDSGFDLLEGKTARVIEKVKRLIIELIHSGKVRGMKVNLSVYLSQATSKDYHTLSSLFSSVESVTIERFFILQRIERAKELMIYDELSLREIAYPLGYSSTSHLSNQFKQTTGLSPRAFKRARQQERRALDAVQRA